MLLARKTVDWRVATEFKRKKKQTKEASENREEESGADWRWQLQTSKEEYVPLKEKYQTEDNEVGTVSNFIVNLYFFFYIFLHHQIIFHILFGTFFIESFIFHFSHFIPRLNFLHVFKFNFIVSMTYNYQSYSNYH